jgi:hypothetical protein
VSTGSLFVSQALDHATRPEDQAVVESIKGCLIL